jgi:glycosyltransferase involved in cell wall biosynthesis
LEISFLHQFFNQYCLDDKSFQLPARAELLKISVITAVYNSEGTVGEAIASVAAQTHPDVEHLVVEGKSEDGSLDAIERAAHGRMRLISEPDRGIYDALNKGVRSASGAVIGFMHSDDFFAHDRVLERIAAAFEDPAVEAVFSDLDYVAQSDTSRVIRHWSTGAFHPRRLKYGWMPAHPTLYLRREVYERFGDYDIKFGIAADYDLILRYFSQVTGKSIYIPEVFYKMRVGGVSNRNWAKIRQKIEEDMLAIRRNRVGGLHTLVLKNLSKIGQFLV